MMFSRSKKQVSIEKRYITARWLIVAMAAFNVIVLLTHGAWYAFANGFVAGVNAGITFGLMFMLLPPFARAIFRNRIFGMKDYDEREVAVVTRSYAHAYPILALAGILLPLYGIAASDDVRLWIPKDEQDWWLVALFAPMLVIALPVFLAKWPKRLAHDDDTVAFD